MADQAENDFPNGKYTFIGVDIDTTGRRILDEVNCKINQNAPLQFQRKIIHKNMVYYFFHRLYIWPRILQRSNLINL